MSLGFLFVSCLAAWCAQAAHAARPSPVQLVPVGPGARRDWRLVVVQLLQLTGIDRARRSSSWVGQSRPAGKGIELVDEIKPKHAPSRPWAMGHRLMPQSSYRADGNTAVPVVETGHLTAWSGRRVVRRAHVCAIASSAAFRLSTCGFRSTEQVEMRGETIVKLRLPCSLGFSLCWTLVTASAPAAWLGPKPMSRGFGRAAGLRPAAGHSGQMAIGQGPKRGPCFMIHDAAPPRVSGPWLVTRGFVTLRSVIHGHTPIAAAG